MEKINFVFLIKADMCWKDVFSHIENLKNTTDETGDIAVVAIGTALLSCLQHTNKKEFRETISNLSKAGVQFYLCINTMHRYGITEDMILPGIKVAEDGGLMRIAKLELQGYHMFALG